MQPVNYIFDGKQAAGELSKAIANLLAKCAAWRLLALVCSGLLMGHVLFDIAYAIFLRH